VRFEPRNLDAGLLMWNVRRRIALDRLPERRVLVYFAYTGFPATYRGPRRFWLVLERSGADICLTDPGYELDLSVDADIGAMARIWLGDLAFADAVRARKIRVSGAAALARQLPGWLLLSPFAQVPRPPHALAGTG
jgi:hypothetical protein